MEPFQLEIKTLYEANGRAEIPGQHSFSLQGNSATGLDARIQTAGELASARHFFAPATDLKAIASHAGVSGLEHTTAAAIQAANQTISPLLQLIMRLPTHVSIFGSFLEAMKNFFLPHTDLVTQLANIDTSGLNNFSHSLSSLGNHHPVGWSIVPAHTHIFQNMAFNGDNLIGTAHLHLNPADSLKHSMNVSAGVDLQHPQFEKLSGPQMPDEVSINNLSNPAGDSLSGPSISTQAITPQVAPAERIFSSKYFDSPANMQINANSNLLASNQNTVSTNVITNNNMVTNNNTIANASTTPSLSSSQSPTTNNIVEATPIEGLHAKALSLASFSGSQHSAHFAASFSHSEANHSIIGPSINHTHTRVAHSPSEKGIQHKHYANDARQSSSPEAIQPISVDAAYTVKPGDTLWHIAHDQLGDSMRWSDLYKMNSKIIGSNPGMIFPGQKFDLPGQLSDGLIAHHTSAATSQIANVHQPAPHSAPHTIHLRHAPPKPEPSVQSSATLAANINRVHSHALSAPHTESMHSALAYKININSNNGLSIENAHDRLLSGAGSAQASTIGQNSAISKAVSNLTAGKSKSVVSFSLTPDLSFLQVGKVALPAH